MISLSALALVAALSPLVFGFALSRLAKLSAVPARLMTLGSALLSLALAIACAVVFAFTGAATRNLIWLSMPSGFQVSIGAHVDGLTVVLLLTVTAIGAAVSRYAIRYLDGDPGQARFSSWLSYTLASVLFLIISSNLLMLFAAWVATSHGLHRLLTYYSDRPAARLVARKKFLTSRIGDLFLLTAFLLIYRFFGTFEFAELLPRAAELHTIEAPFSASWIGVLLVLGAMTKSAQFPFHTWLPDTMETPTPVSALMHAGIINAGGFLVIRMSPLLAASPGALFLLASAGAFTAVLASVVMLTQTDIKRKLAYSTVSQMGFMMLQCGLGAFAVAALHIVGHSFYKAHAFLSAASTVDPHVPQPNVHERGGRVGWSAVFWAAVSGVTIVALALWALGVEVTSKPGLPVLATILAIAIAQIVMTSQQTDPGSTHARTAALRNGVAIALAYVALASLIGRLLVGTVPASPMLAPAFGTGLAAFVLVLFLAGVAAQASTPWLEQSEAGRRLYVHAANGFYLGMLQNRLVQRVWPVVRNRPPTASRALAPAALSTTMGGS